MVILLLLFCLALSTPLHAEQLSVHVHTDPDKIIYGKTLDIQVVADYLNSPIQALRVKPLLRNFSLEYLDKDPGSVEHQELWLRLHPRRAGKLTIPSLQLLDVYSDPVDIIVKPPQVDGKDIIVSASLNSGKVWQRQQTLLTVQIDSPQRFYNVEFDEFNIRGFELIPITVQKSSVEKTAGDKRYRTRLGWILVPLTVDDYQISMPGIRYIEGGWKLFEFYTPQLNLTVKRLPSYVGPDIVVGNLDYQLSAKPDYFQSTKNINHVSYVLHGHGIIADWLPRLDDQFSEIDNLTVYPAIEQQSVETNFDGLSSTQLITVPYKSKGFAWQRIPAVETQFFDPDSGKLQIARVAAVSIFAYSPAGVVAAAFLVAALMIILLYGSRHRVWRWIHHLKQQRESLRQIRHAVSLAELIDAIKHYSRAIALHPNPNLTQLSLAWQRRYFPDPALETALQRLNQLYYGKARQIEGAAVSTTTPPQQVDQTELRELANMLYQRLGRLGRRRIRAWLNALFFRH